MHDLHVAKSRSQRTVYLKYSVRVVHVNMFVFCYKSVEVHPVICALGEQSSGGCKGSCTFGCLVHLTDRIKSTLRVRAGRD